MLRRFRGQNAAALHSYLRVIAASVASDRLRAEPPHSVSLDDPESVPSIADDCSAQNIERRLLMGRIVKCLGAQGPRNQWIFWLYHRDGMTPQAISTVPSIGIGRSGVETLIYRLTKMVIDCVRRGFPQGEGSVG